MALTLFAEHGYAATTMDDIAEAAGVTKPLVYQHFDSKRALYLELLDVFSSEMIDRIVQATSAAEGPRQQVELGFAGYFELMVDNEDAFRLLYGRDAPDDRELGAALHRVEEAIAVAIDPLIDAGLDPEHRLLLAHAVVGMAEGASRHWLDDRRTAPVARQWRRDRRQCRARRTVDRAAEAARLAAQLADFAWAGLRQVHRIWRPDPHPGDGHLRRRRNQAGRSDPQGPRGHRRVRRLHDAARHFVGNGERGDRRTTGHAEGHDARAGTEQTEGDGPVPDDSPQLVGPAGGQRSESVGRVVDDEAGTRRGEDDGGRRGSPRSATWRPAPPGGSRGMPALPARRPTVAARTGAH